MSSKQQECPKCCSTFLSLNEDSDVECICGKVIYNAVVVGATQVPPAETVPTGEPTRKGRGLKHYSKIVAVAPLIEEALGHGVGVRQASREFGVAINTVRSLVNEKASLSQVVRRDREKEHHWLRFALKGLATHSRMITSEEMVERALGLLEKYMRGNPQRTVLELMPECRSGHSFKLDDLMGKTVEIMIAESCNYLSDTFERVGDGVYRLREKDVEGY